MKNIFFTISLTESEHGFVKNMFEEFCLTHELKLVYYRKFKTGHVPMYREVKIEGSVENLNKFKKYLKTEKIKVGNYHRDEKSNIITQR